MALDISHTPDSNPPHIRVNLQAGPSKTHRPDSQQQAMLTWANEQSHRDPWAKELLRHVGEETLQLLGIPKGKWNNGWHVTFTNSGTDGMERALRAACLRNGTVLMNTDEFSEVAQAEIRGMHRDVERISHSRGRALHLDSEDFHRLTKMIQNGNISTLYFTCNGTTTGTFQREAIEALVKIRDEAGTDVMIVVDEVSAQWWGAQARSAVPDILFTAGQKDMAIGTGIGVLVFNNRALERARKVNDSGLDAGLKLGLLAAYGTDDKRMAATGQTAQTPPLDKILMMRWIQDAVLNKPGQRDAIHTMQAGALQAILRAVSDGDLGELGFGMLVKNPRILSPTSHVLTTPPDIDGKILVRNIVRKYGIALSAGYGKHAPSEVRIGAYSAAEPKDIQDAIAALVEEARGLKRPGSAL